MRAQPGGGRVLIFVFFVWVFAPNEAVLAVATSPQKPCFASDIKVVSVDDIALNSDCSAMNAKGSSVLVGPEFDQAIVVLPASKNGKIQIAHNMLALILLRVDHYIELMRLNSCCAFTSVDNLVSDGEQVAVWKDCAHLSYSNPRAVSSKKFLSGKVGRLSSGVGGDGCNTNGLSHILPLFFGRNFKALSSAEEVGRGLIKALRIERQKASDNYEQPIRKLTECKVCLAYLLSFFLVMFGSDRSDRFASWAIPVFAIVWFGMLHK